VKLGTSNFMYWLIQRSTSACMIYYTQTDVLRVMWPL